MSADQTREIAEKLVDYCRRDDTYAGLEALYAADAVSVEAAEQEGGGPRVTEGRDGIKGKHDWWAENFEVHGAAVDGPFLHGEDRFGVIFEMDATHKASGHRAAMKEIGIYTVANGKIVREEFFYTM
ncbi:MAG: nuclear transport factor 2 family protein [Pseudomonadota bacterium]